MPKNKSQLRLVAIPAAAEIADVHPKTVRRWIAQGLITGYRVGPRFIKVDLGELEAFFRPIPSGAA